MQTFKSFLSEEVVPTAYVHNGLIDLNKEEVRNNINIILKSIGSKMYVTPYSGLHHISKALAQFSIILPKKTFMEGDKGIEAYEMRQFGNVVGMNDEGEFINEVPTKFYLFVKYQLIGLGMFQVLAKVVDKGELDSLINHAEVSLAEWKNKDYKKEKGEIPDSDDVPFKGGHKASKEEPMSHAHRLAMKAKARYEKRKLEELYPTKQHPHQDDDGEDDEKKKMVMKAIQTPVQKSMDQMVRRIRNKVGRRHRHRE